MARGMHTLCRVSIQAGYEIVNVREWEMPGVRASAWSARSSAETENCQEQKFLFSLSLTARGRGQKLTILEFFKNFYALVMKKTVIRQISTHAYCSAMLEKIFSIHA